MKYEKNQDPEQFESLLMQFRRGGQREREREKERDKVRDREGGKSELCKPDPIAQYILRERERLREPER